MKKTFIFLTLGIFLSGIMSLFGWNSSRCQADESKPLDIDITQGVPEYTNDNIPNVGLIVTEGVDFEIKVNGAVVGSGIGTGREQIITLNEFVDGNYYLTVTATRELEVFSVDSDDFTIDTVSSEINIADITTNKKITLNAEASDSSGIQSYLWKKKTGPGTVAFSNTAVLEPEVEADADGAYLLELTATDKAGNQSSKTLTVVWDTTPSKVSGVTEGATYNVDVVPIFDGTATLDGNPFSSGTNISSDGEHTLIVEDMAGNETTVHFTIDQIAPEVVITKDPDTNIHNGDYTVSAEFGDAVVKEYKLDDGEWLNYTGPIVISSEGNHTICFRGTDAAGNETGAEVTFEIDKTVPEAPVIGSVRINRKNANNFEISGQAEPLAKIMLEISDGKNNPIFITTEANNIGIFFVAVNLSDLSDGQIVIKARQTDRAGNVSQFQKKAIQKDTARRERKEKPCPAANSSCSCSCPNSSCISQTTSSTSASSPSTVSTSKTTLPKTGMDPVWIIFISGTAAIIGSTIMSLRSHPAGLR